MSTGVYKAKKKDGSIYYRSNLHFKNKNISLGSYDTFEEAHAVHLEAKALVADNDTNIPDAFEKYPLVPFDKAVTLVNYRNFKMYFGVPIYLNKRGFSYFITQDIELKFDNDDLFYYSVHRIMKRGGHMYVNDYGSQINILSRYGIKNYAVAGIDYEFINGDEYDFRYENIRIINPYYGVTKLNDSGRISYQTRIHINGNYQIGIYSTIEEAAIAYNKAVDLAKVYGVIKNYPVNYINNLSAKDYADIYVKINVSKAYRDYLKTIC